MYHYHQRDLWVFLKVKDASFVGRVLPSPSKSGPSEAKQDSFRGQARRLQRLGKTPCQHLENKQWNSLESVQVCIIEKVLPSNSTSFLKSSGTCAQDYGRFKNAEDTPTTSPSSLNEGLGPWQNSKDPRHRNSPLAGSDDVASLKHSHQRSFCDFEKHPVFPTV